MAVWYADFEAQSVSRRFPLAAVKVSGNAILIIEDQLIL
jgi:hypothetical protein